MSLKIILVIISFKVSTHQIMSIDNSVEEKDILRAKFLNDKRKHNITATQVKLLEKYASNDTVFVDDILHYKIKGHPQLKEVNQIEDEFRNMIAMDGLTYIYNRDLVWRTWRKVTFENKARIVHYKYGTTINCTKHCETGGFWVIEKDPPPCALEIFSIDKTAVCIINMKHYHMNEMKCSNHLYSFLTSTCDNPIVTRWVVQKTFTKKEKKQRFPVVICGGREYCRLLTVYKITSDHVSFKIINSTNHIIYSRIMMNTHKNYACVTNCGIFDRQTNTVKKSEKPMKLNMFNKNIEKREEINANYNSKAMKNDDEKPKRYISKKKLTTHSPSCKNLRHNHVHDSDDMIVDNEDVDDE